MAQFMYGVLRSGLSVRIGKSMGWNYFGFWICDFGLPGDPRRGAGHSKIRNPKSEMGSAVLLDHPKPAPPPAPLAGVHVGLDEQDAAAAGLVEVVVVRRV